MGKIREYISSQCGRPRGIIGKICVLVMNVVNRKMYDKAIALLDVSEDDKVLEIGYGNGYLLNRLYKKTGASLYGIDISEDMKYEAKRRNIKALSDGKLHLKIGDCCDLKYRDSKFSAAVSLNTIYFWSDTVKGLSEIHRCLKEGGSFYNVVYSKEGLDKIKHTATGYKKFTTDQLILLGKQAGFEKIEVMDVEKGKTVVVVYTK